MSEFADLLQSDYELAAGDPGPYTLGQELSNVFARVDWNLDANNRLTLRHVFASAQNDESPNRATFEPYELSSNGVHRRSESHSTSAQLFSDLGVWANELNLELKRSVDETEAAAGYR